MGVGADVDEDGKMDLAGVGRGEGLTRLVE